jgi:hypothetical protein
MPDQETIFVRAANTNRKVALSEGNSAHPLGEATARPIRRGLSRLRRLRWYGASWPMAI